MATLKTVTKPASRPAPQQTQAKAPASKNLPATQEASGPPAALLDLYEQHAGKGVSKDQADNLVPLIYVLQAQSPQVLSRNEKYIEGAVAGDIWLRQAPDPIVKAEEGCLVQPVYFSKCWIEWIDRDSGGGFVQRHAELPSDAERHVDPKNPNKVAYVSRENPTHQYVETREHIVIVHADNGERMPYVIPFSGSGHTVSRAWMTNYNRKRLPSGGTAPSFAYLYRMTTEYRTNNQGEWFVLHFDDHGWVQSAEDIEAAAALYDAFATGKKTVDDGQYSEATGEGMGDGGSYDQGDEGGDDGRP